MEAKRELWRKEAEALELEFWELVSGLKRAWGRAVRPSARAAGTFNSGGISPANKFYNRYSLDRCMRVHIYVDGFRDMLEEPFIPSIARRDI